LQNKYPEVTSKRIDDFSRGTGIVSFAERRSIKAFRLVRGQANEEGSEHVGRTARRSTDYERTPAGDRTGSRSLLVSDLRLGAHREFLFRCKLFPGVVKAPAARSRLHKYSTERGTAQGTGFVENSRLAKIASESKCLID